MKNISAIVKLAIRIALLSRIDFLLACENLSEFHKGAFTPSHFLDQVTECRYNVVHTKYETCAKFLRFHILYIPLGCTPLKGKPKE